MKQLTGQVLADTRQRRKHLRETVIPRDDPPRPPHQIADRGGEFLRVHHREDAVDPPAGAEHPTQQLTKAVGIHGGGIVAGQCPHRRRLAFQVLSDPG